MKLIIPESLQRFTDEILEIELGVINLAQLQAALEEVLPKLAKVIFSDGKLNPYVRIALNQEFVSEFKLVDLQIQESDQLELLVAISGG